MQGLFVVHRDFVAGMNVAQREKDYVAIDGAHIGVRFARVINVMRAVAAPTAIDAPNAVDVTDAQLCPVGAPLRFAIRNTLTSVFGDLAATREVSNGKTASAVNI